MSGSQEFLIKRTEICSSLQGSKKIKITGFIITSLTGFPYSLSQRRNSRKMLGFKLIYITEELQLVQKQILGKWKAVRFEI
jgi:hypothetical protein